jgi:hypothetical protein
MSLNEFVLEDAALTWFGELVEDWPDIPKDFKNKLRLKPGLALV